MISIIYLLVQIKLRLLTKCNTIQVWSKRGIQYSKSNSAIQVSHGSKQYHTKQVKNSISKKKLLKRFDKLYTPVG
jgi:hypothetical protein